MTRSDQILADAEAVLNRTSDRYRSLSSRTQQRRNAAAIKKFKRIIVAVLVVVIGAAVVGWFVPLGTSGIMIVLALILAAIVLFGMIPGQPQVKVEKLAETDLKALPLQTEIWLDNQRKALPAPAVQLIDSIGARLETLAPQLATLNPQEPAALEVRRLLSDHLPELVTGYQNIPEPMRRQERNGRVPEKQLIEGLGVIDSEIDRMTEQLAAGNLDSLSTHTRFLELKYQEAKQLGAPESGQ